MPKYKVLDSSENVENIIIASEAFVKSNYSNYELVVDSNEALKKTKAMDWRNSELERTDVLMLLPDYPYKNQITVYRQALRDWPSTEDFPDNKPRLGI